MKKFSMKTVFIIIAIVVLVASAISCVPYLVNKSTVDQRKDAGLTIKSTDIPDFKIVYAEGGSGDTIIMVHGFAGNKDNWLSFAKHFTPHYRVIIPDLPGNGESSKPQDKNYSIMSQVERLNLFVKELKLTKFHIIGISEGGNFAGNYAADYPEMVKTLALFDSSGVRTPPKSELRLLLDKGINPMIVKDEKSLDKYYEFLFVKPPKFHDSIKKYLAEQAVKDKPFNDKISKDMDSDRFILERKLNKIMAPTLVGWGDSDKVIHISAVSIFEKGIKNSKSVIIKECGHIPTYEKPAETASIYQEFLKVKH